MPGAKRSTSTVRAQLPPWEYLGGESLNMDDTPQALTIPSETSIITIDAEDAKVYYAVNGPLASAASPGYVPADQGRILGPISNLVSCSVFGVLASAAIAHVQYFREV